MPRHDTEGGWITVDTFYRESQLPWNEFPEVIDIRELQFKSQPHKAIISLIKNQLDQLTA
jgi:hypothetical protein